jgi:hypothetical protein
MINKLVGTQHIHSKTWHAIRTDHSKTYQAFGQTHPRDGMQFGNFFFVACNSNANAAFIIDRAEMPLIGHFHRTRLRVRSAHFLNVMITLVPRMEIWVLHIEKENKKWEIMTTARECLCRVHIKTVQCVYRTCNGTVAASIDYYIVQEMYTCYIFVCIVIIFGSFSFFRTSCSHLQRHACI